MTWFVASENLAAATAEHAVVVDFVDLDFPSGHLRVHTWLGTITWGGYDWIGVGQLGAITIGAEDAELRPVAFTLGLSGVDASLVRAARTEAYHGRPARVYRGWLDTATRALVATPERRRTGLMDTMTTTLGHGSGSITVSCESELARWQRPRGLMYTHESQQIIYEGDRGFDLIPTIQTRSIDWGPYRTVFGMPIEGMLRDIINRLR